jgi:hypothetical protein
MGNLLKHIADIENYIEKAEDRPQQQKQQQPVAKAPAKGVQPAGSMPIAKTSSNVGQPMGKPSTGQRPIGQPPTYSSQ